MNTTTIEKIKIKHNLNDEDITAICNYIVTENKVYSWKQGKGATSKAKPHSQNTIARNFFATSDVIQCINDIKKIMSVDAFDVSERDKQEEIEPANNNNDIKLGSNMTNKELVDYFNTRVRSVKDPNKRFEYEMRIMEKLDVKANNHDTDDNKANVYLPERCDACKYQIVIDKLRKEIKELKASK